LSAKDLIDRQKRLETLNLVSFLHRDEEGKVDLEVVGRTLDLSEGGILLEIPHTVPSTNKEVEVTLGIRDNVIQTVGEIVHLRELENGHFGLGISFKDLSDTDAAIIAGFLGENGE
jgi:hypothetical protein